MIKNKIKDTRFYKTLLLENENLKRENTHLKNKAKNFSQYKSDVQAGVTKLKARNKALEKGIKSINNRNATLTNLNTNFKYEIQSLKRVFVEKIEPSEDYSKLTFIIPYRRSDDERREENLDITLRYLSDIGISNMIISEHSDVSYKKFLQDKYGHLFDSFTVIWNNSKGKLFNLAIAINKGVMETTTPYFAMSDSDCITKKENINKAIALLDNGFDVIHPFNRSVTDIVDKEKFEEEYDFETVMSPEQVRPWADGGIVIWNKFSFISMGMKNEFFEGWGGEDNETIVRSNLLQINQYRIDDTLYHLYHERIQTRTDTNKEQLRQMKEIENKERCLEEINKWPWVVEAKNKFLK